MHAPQRPDDLSLQRRQQSALAEQSSLSGVLGRKYTTNLTGRSPFVSALHLKNATKTTGAHLKSLEVSDDLFQDDNDVLGQYHSPPLPRALPIRSDESSSCDLSMTSEASQTSVLLTPPSPTTTTTKSKGHYSSFINLTAKPTAKRADDKVVLPAKPAVVGPVDQSAIRQTKAAAALPKKQLHKRPLQETAVESKGKTRRKSSN